MTQPWFWMMLGIAFTAFWLVPLKLRLSLLTGASLAFIYLILGTDENARATITAQRIALLAMVGWAMLFYLLAPLTQRPGSGGKWLVVAQVVGIIGFLAWFKYLPIFLPGSGGPLRLFIPLGISYFTFKLIHYVLEIRRGTIKDRSLDAFLSYVFLFPAFTAGPIERFDHYLANRETRLSSEAITYGLTRIFVGLVKFLVISQMVVVLFFGRDRMDALLYNFNNLSPWDVWKFLIAAYVQMYLGFSAYSDLAVGASRLFGLKIVENFNWPIFATNITDFWKRWHISLANWCMTYIYMPALGKWRNPYIASYLTFIIMGIWHAGALPWIAWGLYHATGLAMYQWWGKYRRQKKWKFFNGNAWKYACIPITFLAITGSFAFTEVYGYGGTKDGLLLLAKMCFLPVSR
ncbi:MAG: MBOAT family O-acyltransferase [Phycisphaeraceae bacterium]